MSRTRIITTAIMLSLLLSGCEFMNETQWLAEQGW